MPSYSQEGEDIVLNRLVNMSSGGFYVDIGAHHPFRFSNTFLLYKNGWSGLVLDASENTIKMFKRWRPRDICLNVGVGQRKEKLDYFEFEDSALNTFDRELADQYVNLHKHPIVSKKKIKLTTLSDIFSKYANGKQIDILNIDIEEFDLKALRSNNWRLFRPKIIIDECLKSKSIKDTFEDPIVLYLEKKSYMPVSRLVNSIIFEDMGKH